MKKIMIGNAAVARGLYEAGCHFVSSYPGTPSTEITEHVAKYDEVYVSGLCLGAVLALAVGIKFKEKVKGIISLSTTLYLDGWRLPWYSFLSAP